MPDAIDRPFAISDSCPDLGVYVACLASYNAGKCHGHWVDLKHISDVGDIRECINYIIKTSPEPAEEYACHEWSGIPKCIASERPNWGDVIQYIETITDLHENEVKAYNYWCNNIGEVISKEDFRSIYCGSYKSEQDYAHNLFNEIYNLDENPLVKYVNWEDVWRDLSVDGYCSISRNGEYHIFRSI